MRFSLFGKCLPEAHKMLCVSSHDSFQFTQWDESTSNWSDDRICEEVLEDANDRLMTGGTGWGFSYDACVDRSNMITPGV